MKTTTRLFAGRVTLGAGAAFLLAHAPLALAQPVQYSVDDGTGSGNSGFAQASDIVWGNYFFAQPGAQTITTISAAFGNIDGRPITVHLFEDPDDDGNPANAVPILSLAAFAQRPASNFFADYAITPTTVSGGFFVAIQRVTLAGEFPARRDDTTPRGQSWIAAAPAATGIDLNNLGASPVYFNLSQNVPPSNWMVRATGIPSPGAAVLAGLGVAGAGLSRRRRSRDVSRSEAAR